MGGGGGFLDANAHPPCKGISHTVGIWPGGYAGADPTGGPSWNADTGSDDGGTTGCDDGGTTGCDGHWSPPLAGGCFCTLVGIALTWCFFGCAPKAALVPSPLAPDWLWKAAELPKAAALTMPADFTAVGCCGGCWVWSAFAFAGGGTCGGVFTGGVNGAGDGGAGDGGAGDVGAVTSSSSTSTGSSPDACCCTGSWGGSIGWKPSAGAWSKCGDHRI